MWWCTYKVECSEQLLNFLFLANVIPLLCLLRKNICVCVCLCVHIPEKMGFFYMSHHNLFFVCFINLTTCLAFTSGHPQVIRYMLLCQRKLYNVSHEFRYIELKFIEISLSFVLHVVIMIRIFKLYWNNIKYHKT
jgi:hypothetical protein